MKIQNKNIVKCEMWDVTSANSPRRRGGAEGGTTKTPRHQGIRTTEAPRHRVGEDSGLCDFALCLLSAVFVRVPSVANIWSSSASPCLRGSNIARNLSFGAAAVLLATAGCTLRQAYPETEIRGYINGQPFSVRAPKDANLTGFDAVATTNGQVHVHIDSLQASLNATNLANAGNAQAAIVTATGAAINQAIQTAAGAALKAAQ